MSPYLAEDYMEMSHINQALESYHITWGKKKNNKSIFYSFMVWAAKTAATSSSSLEPIIFLNFALEIF